MQILLNKLSSSALRTKMLLLFGGGATIILILIQLVQLFGLPVFEYSGEYIQHSKKINAETRAIAENKKDLIRLWFTERLGDIQVLSNQQLVKKALEQPAKPLETEATNPSSGLLHHLELIRAAYGIYEVIDIVEATTGITRVSTKKSHPNTLHPLAKEIFSQGNAMDRIKIIFKSRGKNQPASLFITAPIHIGTNYTADGAVILQISTDVLLEQIFSSDRSMADTGEIILIDMNKRLLTPLAHPLEDGQYATPLQYTLTTKAADFAAWGVDSLIETVDYRGQDVLSAVRHIRLTQDFAISMIVNRSKADLYAPVWRDLLIFIAISFTGIAAAMGLVLLTARQLARPLEQLSTVSNRIQNGDLSARVPDLLGREAGSLGQAFNAMADAMEHAQNTLQNQVETRTQALQKSEERIRVLLNNIPDLVWLKDSNGVFLGCNTAFERLLGTKDDAIIGKTDYDFFHAKLADFFRMHDQNAIKAGKSINNEEWLTSAQTHQKRLYYTTKTPIYESSGDFIGVLGIGRDITEIKNNEEENRKLQEQLQQAQKIESIGRLAGGVAHDFNNILSVILGHADLGIDRLPPNAPALRNIKEIKRAAIRSAALVKQLLTFARKQEISPQQLNLNTCVESMLDMLRRLIGENIDLAWRPAVTPMVRMDPTQLEQVLANLCINAKDAISDTGKITIATGRTLLEPDDSSARHRIAPDTYATLVVSDNGSGISDEVQENMFEPFFTTKGIGKGTGLGLSTVYGVVKQNRGTIEVESGLGKGTCFTIFLPLCRDAEEEKSPKKTDSRTRWGNESVLIIEDEPALLKMATQILAESGYKVYGAITPDQAMLHARRKKDEIKLIITDVIMPEINGKDLADKLLKILPGCKCLFMSGYTADVIAHHGVLEKGVNFIHKPFTSRTLTHKVREILDQAD